MAGRQLTSAITFIRTRRSGSPAAVMISTAAAITTASRLVCIEPSATSSDVAMTAGCPARNRSVANVVKTAASTAAHVRSGVTNANKF